MAHTATHSDSFTASFGSAIIRGFAKIGTALVSMGESSARLKQVNALNALSDQDLATRGIKRTNIVQHVYRDILWL
ncbi:MAG: hypothetical protein ACI8R4_001077 [Paracoccaceae bacterium]|jgi:hypothetical protein